MFEANYPERSKRIIVVQAPKAFPFAYNLIKPFLDAATRDKIAVLGSKSFYHVIHTCIIIACIALVGCINLLRFS